MFPDAHLVYMSINLKNKVANATVQVRQKKIRDLTKDSHMPLQQT